MEKAQDQPQFSNKDNKCLNCAGDHRTHDCPTRQQHQAPTTSNPASGSSIYQHQSQFPNMPSQHHYSPQQHLPQSQSTVVVTTPMLMVNNPQFQPSLQGHHQSPAQVPLVNQQANYLARPPKCN